MTTPVAPAPTNAWGQSKSRHTAAAAVVVVDRRRCSTFLSTGVIINFGRTNALSIG
jgi:hypothetical protein